METNMKHQKVNRIWFMLGALVIIALACLPSGIQPVPSQAPQGQPTPIPQGQPTPVPQNPANPNNPQTGSSRTNLIAATVQIYGLVSQNGKLTPVYSGSGTIISSTGLILTNAHVASPASQGDTASEPDALAIGLMDQEDKPPVFSYFAKVKAVDGYVDLAVIQITTTMDGADVSPNSLNLPFVQLGNSDDLHIGDHINIYGFPGIGGKTITFTDGSVSGFTQEDKLGDRAWIKTAATIAGGNSGGLAANDAGFIIGVPTSASAGTGGNVTDCRVIQDTNGDGVIDSRDSCIPIGGFINGLRPINLALPLIKAAQAGQEYASPFSSPSQTVSTGSGQETFGQISWYTGTGGTDCQLKDPVSSFPSGTNAVAAAFDFSGMTDGEPAAEKWTVDGAEIYNSKYDWNLGSQGHSFTCLYNPQKAMPDGKYHLELYAGQNLDLMAKSDIVVGGNPGSSPSPTTDQGVVTVFGQITDANSKNPLPGAQIFVLNPGTTFDKWKANSFADSDIFTSAKADNQGNYQLADKLAQNVGYTLVVYSEGYPINYADNLTWTEKQPLNFQLDFKMSN
jgi:serine protease Do